MKIRKSTSLKLASLACFMVGIQRAAHGRTLNDNLPFVLGVIFLVAAILLAYFAFRLERSRQ